jgi:two-component system, sensor histidine kinase and response regulator
MAAVLKYSKLIQGCANLVGCRMKDLLDSNLIENGKFVANQVEFRACQAIEEIATIIQQSIEKFDVDFLFDFDPALSSVLLGDVNRIQQVLLNLLTNARKYVPKKKGVIKIVSRFVSKLTGDYLMISVLDNGPGIKAENLNKLFKPFS